MARTVQSIRIQCWLF